MTEPEIKDPRKEARRAVSLVYGLALAGILVWLAAIFLAPFLRSRGEETISAALYAAFSPVCHQIPDRCLLFRGHPLAVCARCLGIYAGFLAGLALYPLLRRPDSLALPKARFVVLAALPMGLDFLAGITGVWPSPPVFRLATGIVWGAVLPAYFVPGIAEALFRMRARRSGRHILPTGGRKR